MVKKIPTAEALDEEIDRETSWRKRELSNTVKIVNGADGSVERSAIRSGILVLYAHWEGWVKNIAKLYIRHVNSQKCSYDALSGPFLGSALKTRLSEFEQAGTPQTHNGFVTFLRNDLSGRATVSEDLVQTESNLSSRVFASIVERIGVPSRRVYSTRTHLVDNELLSRRNCVAHGEYLSISSEEFVELKDLVLEILEVFTNDVRNAAWQKNYLV